MRDIKLKSADRADFDLKIWLLPAIQQLHLTHFSWLDIITTVSAVVADSIVESVIKTSDLNQETCVIMGACAITAIYLNESIMVYRKVESLNTSLCKYLTIRLIILKHY